MKARKNKKGTGAELIEEIRARERRKLEIQRQVQLLESEIGEKRRVAHRALIQEFAEKAGMQPQDIEAFWNGIQRRQKVQRRLITRGYNKIRVKSLDMVKSEAERRQAIRKRYWSLHADKYKERAGNPELKFYTAIGHWTTEHQVPDRGMIGWGFDEPDIGTFDCTLEMDVDEISSGAGHYLYPHAYVWTGDIETPMTLEVSQTIVLRHQPLASGRGDFRVDRVRVDFSGVGNSRARMGDTCPLEAGRNIWATTNLTLKVEADQFDYEEGLFLQDFVVDELSGGIPAGSGTHDQVVEVEFGTRDTPHDVYLYNNGSEIWLYLNLVTRVSAGDENAFSEINFSREDTAGLMLGCVTLIGEYA